MFRKTTLFAAVLALPFMGLAACDDATGPGGDATLSVQLTDAPSANVDSAWVKIDQITLQGSEGGVDLLDGPTGFIELTQLADSATTLVQDKAVPQGSYGQLRFHVNAAALQTDGEEIYSLNGGADSIGKTATGDLTCPSCTETGIKVNTPDGFRLETEAKILMLDFDVKESFGQQAGMSGMWVMHPTITSSTIEASGTVSGNVSVGSEASFPTCDGEETSVEDFVPQAYVAGTEDLAKTGNVDSDGSYAVQYLAPGDYDMSFADSVVVATQDTLVYEATHSDTAVTVESGMETTVDYTVTSVSCVLSN